MEDREKRGIKSILLNLKDVQVRADHVIKNTGASKKCKETLITLVNGINDVIKKTTESIYRGIYDKN